MTTLQNDILEIYNSLVVFNKETLESAAPTPIRVSFEKESLSLFFEQKGVSVRMALPIYYSLALDDLKEPTYLLPKDYDYLMSTLQSLIASGVLIKDRVCVSPENYGFDIYHIDLKNFIKGPDLLGQVRFVSGTGWLFRVLTKRKYKL
jgi:hypothetical protein